MHETDDNQTRSPSMDHVGGPALDRLVSVESQREFDLFTGEWSHRVFVKLYVAARTSGLLGAISDRDWKTLCTLATYMDGEGYCYPSQAELAAAMGCSRQMANERVRSLASFRFQEKPVLVIVKGKRGSGGKWTGNGYRVLSLSSLRIYADAADFPINVASNDSDDDSTGVSQKTVSSRLDTVRIGKTTVSSQTGTVALDTNKNHSLEQDRNLSKFERSHDEWEMENRNDASSMSGETVAAEADELATASGSGTPVALGEILRLRAASTSIGNTSDHAVRAVENKAPTLRRSGANGSFEERERLRAFLADFSRELGDEAPLAATITRTLNIFKAADVAPEQWSDYLYQARGLTQEHTAQIRKLAGDGGDGIRRKNKMPYFFATLEQLVGLRPAPAGPERPPT
jgi:hypothetical protein